MHHPLHPLRWLPRPFCLSTSALSISAQDLATVNFATDVRPILADKCFKSHGPDAGQRATDLRLDEEASVHKIAAKPGQPEPSELLRRIDSQDQDLIMPPPDTKSVLTLAEREVLRKWVAEGAKFSKHWSFESLKPIAVPDLS